MYGTHFYHALFDARGRNALTLWGEIHVADILSRSHVHLGKTGLVTKHHPLTGGHHRGLFAVLKAASAPRRPDPRKRSELYAVAGEERQRAQDDQHPSSMLACNLAACCGTRNGSYSSGVRAEEAAENRAESFDARRASASIQERGKNDGAHRRNSCLDRIAVDDDTEVGFGLPDRRTALGRTEGYKSRGRNVESAGQSHERLPREALSLADNYLFHSSVARSEAGAFNHVDQKQKSVLYALEQSFGEVGDRPRQNGLSLASPVGGNNRRGKQGRQLRGRLHRSFGRNRASALHCRITNTHAVAARCNAGFSHTGEKINDGSTKEIRTSLLGFVEKVETTGQKFGGRQKTRCDNTSSKPDADAVATAGRTERPSGCELNNHVCFRAAANRTGFRWMGAIPAAFSLNLSGAVPVLADACFVCLAGVGFYFIEGEHVTVALALTGYLHLCHLSHIGGLLPLVLLAPDSTASDSLPHPASGAPYSFPGPALSDIGTRMAGSVLIFATRRSGPRVGEGHAAHCLSPSALCQHEVAAMGVLEPSPDAPGCPRSPRFEAPGVFY